MKTKKPKKNVNRKTIIAVVILVVALLGIAWFTHHYQFWPFQPSQNSQSSQATKDNSDSTNDQTKAKTLEQSTQNSNVDSSKTTSQIPISKDVSIQINQLSEDASNVTYSATISNPGATGTCSAVFTNNIAKPVVPPVTSAENGSCGPVSIPNETFTALGEWLLTLRYYTNNSQAVATRTIEVK